MFTENDRKHAENTSKFEHKLDKNYMSTSTRHECRKKSKEECLFHVYVFRWSYNNSSIGLPKSSIRCGLLRSLSPIEPPS